MAISKTSTSFGKLLDKRMMDIFMKNNPGGRNNKTLFQWLTKCEHCTWPARNASGSRRNKTKAGQFCHPCQDTSKMAVPMCELEKS